MRQRLTRYGGVGAFLLGLGFSVTGWTNAGVGVTLMVLGVLWEVGALAGPPLATHAKKAVVEGVAAELKVALAAPQAEQSADRKRWLKGVTKRMLGELAVARERLDEARGRGWYWDADVYSLVSDEWAANHKAVSDEPELQGHYMEVRLAFEELNRINTVVIARANHPMASSHAVEQNDRLDGAIVRIDEALRRLQEVGNSL
jgi:hypothetical protein